MPPKAKFTREEILRAALRLTERDGFDALTARALADELGSSARPIFTVFSDMNELRDLVIVGARELYTEYVERGLAASKAFKGVGEAYIRFAAERPKLFMLLFMREGSEVPNIDAVLGEIDGNAEKILASLTAEYGIERELAKRLYIHLWLYTHGIASAIATKVCAFSSDEISEMMTEVFVALFHELKKEEHRI
ncbi:MAG: WHG domain-containing protein [Roseburia sp.]|nr:WHG domain-containing protein [Roseburia sp.]